MLTIGRPRVFRRGIFSCLCAFLTFLLVCAGIRELFPREVQGVSPKLRSFAEQKDQIDIVFLGSSRVFHGIAPDIFDQVARAHGYHWRSFNAGLDSLGTGEGFAIVRRLLALHPHKLRYLFLELGGGIEAGTPTRDDGVTERNIYWRDWDSLILAFRVFLAGLTMSDSDLPGAPYSLHRLMTYGPFFSADVRLWAQNQTNFGRGFKLVKKSWAEFRSQPSETDWPPPPKWDGFFGMSRPMKGDTLAGYRKDFAIVRDGKRKRSPDPVMLREVDRLRRFLESKKIRLVLVVPPSLLGGRGGGINAPAGPLLLSYDDYERYPEFYKEDNRMDPEHLNAHGAELFSRQLAADFLSEATAHH